MATIDPTCTWSLPILAFGLIDVYLFAAIIGGGYVVIAFLLGQIGGGGEAGHEIDAGGHDFDAAGGHELDAGGDVHADVSGHGHDLGGFGHVAGGHGHDHGGHGHAADGHAHAGQVIGPRVFGPLSPLIIAMFLACFGLAGWATVRPPLSLGYQSLILAIGLAWAVTWMLMWIFNRVFARAERTSSPSAFELIGLEAEVITPIPASGAGEIAYVVRGARYNAAARSDAGCELARGTRVVIRRRAGTTFLVAPLPAERPG
ncbi:MAG TPA: NfeD family protein [Phycisphaerae bacterium]|nr:NfeD family protein [Phycisphaerae bacterium]HNU43674.1 NfeD family protein [Phycisphaerae bacterium]